MRPPVRAPGPQAPQRRGLGPSLPATCPQTHIISTDDPSSEHYHASDHGVGGGQRAWAQGAEQDPKEAPHPQHAPCFLLGHQAGCVLELGQPGSTLGSDPSAQCARTD